jgi:Domain of unknown function (DUF5134)
VSGPAWIPYSFAIIMVAVSLYCLGRLVAARLWDLQNHADVNISHVLMGAAMAGMLVPSHNPFPAALGESVFGALALWFLVRSIRGAGRGIAWRDEDAGHHLSHYPIHMVMSFAMIYMYAVGTPTGSSSQGLAMVMGAGHVQRGYVSLSLLFIVVLFASAVWQLDSVARFSPARMRLAYAASPSARSPRAAPSSHLAHLAQATVRLADPSADAPAGARRLLAPRLEIACHVAMCIAMGYMLIVML